MPGTYTTTATRSGPVNPTAPAAARYFVAGMFERGLVGAAVRVRSLAELELSFGSRVTYGSAYDDLRTFFEEGGTEAYVSRVVGAAATEGFLSLLDRKAAGGVATLKVEALSAGSWSSGVTVQVAAGTAAGTFKLVVEGPLDGDTETYNNLATVADAVAALEKSKYVHGIDLGSTTTPTTDRIPAIAAATALSAGSDDRASVDADDMVAGLAVFGADLGAGAVGIPGYDASLVGEDAMAHAKAFARLYLGAGELGATDSDYSDLAADLIGADGEYGGVFGPWVRIPMGGGTTKLISPEGAIAGRRAAAHTDVGPWQAPAGEAGEFRFVVGVEREIARPEGDALNEAHVSVIRTVGGTTRLYGWRSLSSDTDNYWLLTGRDVLNALVYACEAVLEQYVFKTIDARGKLLGSVKTSLIGVLEPMRKAGGLYELITDEGDVLDSGYSVDVGPAVNPVALLRQNQLAAVIAVRVSPTGEQINLTIVKAGLTAAV